ncbi:hypothetical protein PR202_ga14212 [Eleusine coracana subsp. coracana]|uniref:Uncharacterized protein n=1 Tax=Eleusine coracana subsp. coracana TaxID=191504 RepID=A0AAV5CGU4_ELECO|nr:hypothetical protein PR202_ga14212 [Eleusine coracana subsp. coracana]
MGGWTLLQEKEEDKGCLAFTSATQTKSQSTIAAAAGGDSKAKMKATLKGRFDGNKATAGTTLAVPAAGDLRFKASATEATFTNGPSLNGLTVTLEKPGAFIVDLKPHNKVTSSSSSSSSSSSAALLQSSPTPSSSALLHLPRTEGRDGSLQDVRFQFMNSALVYDKRLSLTYTHSTSLAPAAVDAPPPPSRTALDCALTVDSANKVSLSHALGSGGCRVKYTYAHGADRLTTIEPVFDTNTNAWEFAVTRKFEGGDAVKGTYHASTKQLGLEWTKEPKAGGSFKVAASFDLSDQSKAPKLVAESTWNYEI